jgi:hypothetical protein
MGNHEPWQVKFRRLLREAAEDIVERPRLVTPRRDSGPRVLPKNWHTPEGQARLCMLCKLPTLGEVTLHEGKWCGNCYHFSILPNRASAPELPPAA